MRRTAARVHHGCVDSVRDDSLRPLLKRFRGEGDPEDDGLFFIGDRLYVVTDLLSALMASLPGEGAEEDADMEEPEPVSVIAYALGSAGN